MGGKIDKGLTVKEEILARIMSDISELCYSAGWMQNLEYVLWHAVVSGERNYGHYSVTQRDIEILKLLSDETQSWIIFNDELEETAIDLDTWKIKFDADIKVSPGLLKG